MNKKIKTDAVDHLFEAVLRLENKEECYSFFEDLCTVPELKALSVSYTHLDVYKRQAMNSTSERSNGTSIKWSRNA